MKVYPLIYSRTKFCDYVSGFLVRPHNLDPNIASKYVSVALEEVKHTGGIRHAVFSVDDFVVYGGAACVTSALLTRILNDKKLDSLDLDYQEYQSDSANRPIIFFIGFAVKRSENNGDELPNIDLYHSYKIYLEYLKKQWNKNSTKTEELQENEYIEVEVSEERSDFIPDIFETNGLCIVKNYNEEQYQKVINYYFEQLVKNPSVNNSFLSNVLPDMLDENQVFKNISIYGVDVDTFIHNKLSEGTNKKTAIGADRTDTANSSGFTTGVTFSVNSSSDSSTSSYKPKTKPISSGGPTVYSSTEQYRQAERESDRKKSIPTSGKIIIAILIVLLVGCLIFLVNRAHTKTHPQKVTQTQRKSDQYQPTNKQVEEIKQQIMENLQDSLNKQVEEIKQDILGNQQDSHNKQVEEMKQQILRNIQDSLNDQLENLKTDIR